MFKLSTMTFIAVILSLNVAFSQEASLNSQMDQNAWKVLLKDLKEGKKSPLKKAVVDKQSIRIEGPGTSGGGNESDSEFYYLAGQVFRDFAARGIETSALTNAKQALEKLKSEQSLHFTDIKLFLDGKEKAAINDYDVFAVVFNEPRWNGSTFAQKRRLIVHELLGLARAFDRTLDDSAFDVTDKLFASLDDANQKEFLTKSDYPKYFTPPSNLNFVMETSEDVILTKEGQTQVCKAIEGEPSVRLENKTVVKDGREKINVTFRITCRKANGEMFGYSNFTDAMLEVVSGNILQHNGAYGRFLMGWVSGNELLIKTPQWFQSLQKNSEGVLEFAFEAEFNGRESFRSTFKH